MNKETLQSESLDPQHKSSRTKQLGEYLKDITEAAHLVNLIFDLTEKAEGIRKAMIEMQSRLATLEQEKTELQAEKARPGPYKQALSTLRAPLLQMVFVRCVDSYLTYISQMLAEIFRVKPETLRSAEMVRLDFVLQHTTLGDLVSALAEREVERLSYQGMKELSGDLEKRVGFKLFEKAYDLARAIRIIEMRNLIVHNRAFINRRFLSRLPDGEFVLGAKLVVDGDKMIEDLDFLAHSAQDIDARAAAQFNLEKSVGT